MSTEEQKIEQPVEETVAAVEQKVEETVEPVEAAEPKAEETVAEETAAEETSEPIKKVNKFLAPIKKCFAKVKSFMK
ncbi:hypothetical protein ACO0R3_000041 [Hanseniaspora guilliermondii]